MAQLLRQMYVDEIDFEAVTIEKIVDLVFTEMIHDKMQQLEKEELAKQDQTDGNRRSRFKRSVLRYSTMKNFGLCSTGSITIESLSYVARNRRSMQDFEVS